MFLYKIKNYNLFWKLNEIDKKNTYLEHASKIIRHDMHSGINTYIPRGISSLQRRLTPEEIRRLNLETPIKLLKEGLIHTQKVYKGVYEFTNLVRRGGKLSKEKLDLKLILDDYLTGKTYKNQVIIHKLPTIEVNESLFCLAIDNLIRNGLKYNDSKRKIVLIKADENFIYVIDNGRGMTEKEFKYLSRPYVRKNHQKEIGSGLGLNISKQIIEEHGFKITSQKLESGGTKIKIKIK